MESVVLWVENIVNAFLASAVTRNCTTAENYRRIGQKSFVIIVWHQFRYFDTSE